MNVLKLKSQVRARDGMRCTKCRMTNVRHLKLFNRQLDVHRIVPQSKYTLKGCVTLCRPCHRLAHGLEPTRSVNLPRDVARRIKTLAVHLGVKPGEYIAVRLADIIERDQDRMLAAMRRELGLTA